jgi:TolB protein
MIKRTIAVLLIVSFIACVVNGQANQPEGLKNYLNLCNIFLQDGGKWKAPNNSSPGGDHALNSYYGFEFSRGINATTIQLKASGYRRLLSEWAPIGEMTFSWNAQKQKVVLQGVSADGSITTGETEMITENELLTVTSTTTAKAEVRELREVYRLTGSELKIITYIRRGNKWDSVYTMILTRMEQPTGNLTYMSTRDGNFEIYSMDTKGENLKNLSCNKATDYAFSYAKDGRLAFYSNRDGNDEIYIIDADGKKQTNITNHAAGDRVPYFSPDGKQVLFISNRDQKSGEIYIMDADGKNLKRLTNNEYFEDAAGWSNDGKKIYFSRELRDLKDTSVNAPGNGEIFVMDANGTNENRLTNRPGFDGGPTLSPDGSKIAFYGKAADGNYEIFLMDADGKNIINITEDALEDYSPSWSPDGKWIAYTNGNSKNYDVWMIHLETKIKTRLTTQPKRDESPIWQRGK